MLGDEVPSARIAWAGLGIGGMVAVAIAVVFLLLHAWRYPPGGDHDGAARVGTIAPPRLQTAPQDEHAAQRSADARAQAIIDAAMSASGGTR